jgi:hypothetical protein
MPGRGAADVVFLVDASRSMEPCIEGVKRHISTFVDVFKNDPNNQWDVRLDFIAHDDKTQEDRAAGVDKDFRERVVSAGGRYDDVDVRVTLIWNNRNDLDLHVFAPSGEELYFAHKESGCGGALDVDRNVGGETTQPVENVRWVKGRAPRGTYRVVVDHFNQHDDVGPTRFRLEVVNGGKVQHFDGTVSPDEESAVCSFAFTGTVAAPAAPAGSGTFEARSVFEPKLLKAVYGGGNPRLFTNDVAAFQRALSEVRTGDNESPIVAVDTALDFPWRDRGGVHRVVIVLTDEPVEGGNRVAESKRLIPDLIQKLHALKVQLFVVSPDSEGFEHLASANGADWNVVAGGDGLRSVDFGKLLGGIAKSITKSQTPLGAPPPTVRRALFGQNRW